MDYSDLSYDTTTPFLECNNNDLTFSVKDIPQGKKAESKTHKVPTLWFISYSLAGISVEWFEWIEYRVKLPFENWYSIMFLDFQGTSKVLSSKKGARKKSELPKENGASSIQLQKYRAFDPIALPAEMWFVSWVYHEHESPTCKNPRYAALRALRSIFKMYSQQLAWAILLFFEGIMSLSNSSCFVPMLKNIMIGQESMLIILPRVFTWQEVVNTFWRSHDYFMCVQCCSYGNGWDKLSLCIY